MPFLPSFAYKMFRKRFFLHFRDTLPCRVKPFANADICEKQKGALTYSHSNSKRPRSISPMAAGPSLIDDCSLDMRPGFMGIQVSLLSHSQTVKVKLSGVSHSRSSLSLSIRETSYSPGDTCCWAVMSAEVAVEKQSCKSTVG